MPHIRVRTVNMAMVYLLNELDYINPLVLIGILFKIVIKGITIILILWYIACLMV